MVTSMMSPISGILIQLECPTERARKCVDVKSAPRQAHSKPKGAGLTRAMNPESVPVNFPEIDKGNKIVR
jgi:hypothetical protein